MFYNSVNTEELTLPDLVKNEISLVGDRNKYHRYCFTNVLKILRVAGRFNSETPRDSLQIKRKSSYRLYLELSNVRESRVYKYIVKTAFGKCATVSGQNSI